MENEERYWSDSNIYFGNDEIVISGMSGRFPATDNIKQLQENLFNKVDLVKVDNSRWKIEHPDIPNRIGTVNNVEKFDAEFFDVPFDRAHTLDPMTRMLLEHTYECIVDAGVNPKQLRGKNTAVIIGTSFLESQEALLYRNYEVGALGIIGCSKSIVANMLSYWLDVKGPSEVIDTACSASLHAVAIACRYIRSGQCQDAIVGTANLCLNPCLTLQFSRLGVLAPNGYCRPFDMAANGYSRSETVAVLYLQKATDAKRIYATCKHIKINNDGYKTEGITFPSVDIQSVLLNEFYNECDIPPSYLDYVEAHGTATKVGDPVEVNAIYNVLCKDRETPLMIGSVKSNIGHAEPASGFGQIAKVIIAMETGFIPPNIHFTKARDDIEVIRNGSIHIVKEAEPIKNGYVGINSFGFGGSNVHVLLQQNPKEKINNGAPCDDVPRLVLLSGRTESSLKSFLHDVSNHKIDVEYVRLLHDIHADDIEGHPWRGYIILDTNISPANSIQEIEYYKGIKRPISFIFSALNSQCFMMGQTLLRFPVFANTIRICDKILQPYNVNITEIFTKADGKVREDAMHTFLCFIALQIGLVDLLTSLGIIPDIVISHYASELVCAYADDCLTIEQVILSSYFIDLACAETKMIKVCVAMVELGYEHLKNICPEDIEIVCRNSRNNSIINGPIKSIQAFIKKLQADNVYVKEISCNSIPYHSRDLAFAKNQLLSNLNNIIPRPKKRSSKWISTSVPRNEWYTLDAKLSSASYHIHSIFNTVLFEQATRMIPSNAVVVEITPDSVLRKILKDSADSSVTNVALAQCTQQRAVHAFLRGIGKLYNYGLQPQVASLYPPVEFPVSRGTPMISPSIRWDHAEDWFVLNAGQTQKRIKLRERIVEINVKEEDYEFMSGHVIDGRNLLPAIGYLIFVWETVGFIQGKMFTTIPIVFQDIQFLRATHLPKEDSVTLMISIQTDSGKFEVTEGDSVIVTGTVYTTSNSKEEITPNDLLENDNDEEEYMTSRDIYKELKLRGYQYSGGFRGIKSATVSFDKGHIIWIGNWVTFMDSMLQMNILRYDTRNLYVPTSIQKIVIDPALHSRKLQSVITEEEKKLPVKIYKEIDAIISGGIEIRGAKATSINRRKPTGESVIEEYRFLPHHDNARVSLSEAVKLAAQLALEDHQIVQVKTMELVEDNDSVLLEDLFSPLLINAFGDMPLIQANVTLLTSPNRFNSADLLENITIIDLDRLPADDKVLIVAGYDLLIKRPDVLDRLLPCLREGGFVLTRETSNITNYDKYLQQYGLNIVLEKRNDDELIVLLKKTVAVTRRTYVHINNDNFFWLEELKLLLNNDKEPDKNSRIIIVGEGNFECGLLGFINCLRKEPGGHLVRGVLIQDDNARKFSPQDSFYRQQLQKDMAINVLRPNETWGSYRHLRLTPVESKAVSSAYVCQKICGDLGTFHWVENDISAACRREDLVQVMYSSLNFKDIMLATGKLTFNMAMLSQRLQQGSYFGMEYVGFDANGQRVMGLCDHKCLANIVVKDKSLCWKIPDTWTLEEAATVPCVYTTAYYALYIHGKMKKGDKVLIHSGTGGVGQSAIHLALHEGCEVFTTVGTAEKRQFIRNKFPSISDDHIGNSRDSSFEQMVMQQTRGHGVDIVLNSLAEEKLIASVRCLARNGHFLEIGKFDIVSNNPLGMDAFLKGITFHGILLDNFFNVNHKYKSSLCEMITNGLKSGVIKPIQVKVFAKSEIESAFRHMTGGKHIGKIIINIREKEEALNAPIIAVPRYYCSHDKSYIIIGGLGGFGLELTDWLIIRGARTVVLTSRAGIKNGYQRMKIKLWKSYGTNVIIMKNINAADPKDCEYLLQTSENEAPVDAVFNLAVVLKDNILKNQTADAFAESFKAKAWATQTLDKLSRKICPKLRHFVVFSSVSCGRGNIGQTNYGMANSVMERVCESRSMEGLPGLAIQWGAVGDVGLVADMQEDNKELVIGGTLQQNISSCLDELDKFLLQNRPIVSSMVVAEKKPGTSGFTSILETVANIMDIKDMKTVSQNTALAEFGIDSMMVVEIKQILEREFDVFLTASEIRNLTFAKLKQISNASCINDNTETIKKANGHQSGIMKLLAGMLTDEDFISGVCLELSSKREKDTTEVFFVPGITGCGTIFQYVASSVVFSATALQYNTSNVDATNTVPKVADCLLKYILPRLKGSQDFVIVGYSFGAILAIELTRKLEAMRYKGRLILIDGAPEQIQTWNEHQAVIFSDVDLQINILITIIELYKSGNNEEFAATLMKCETWEERIEIFTKYFLTMNAQLSLKNLKTFCMTVYKHASFIREYEFATLPIIKSPITLLKPTLSYTSEIEEDYGLQKITQKKVEVYYIEGDHTTILRNDKVAAVINGDLL